jgi:hypothetical protein
MYRIPVSSSDIRSVGYDPSSSTLEVEFVSGGIYHYFDVPEHLYHGLLNAPSKGRFLHQYIKFNYRYQRVG